MYFLSPGPAPFGVASAESKQINRHAPSGILSPMFKTGTSLGPYRIVGLIGAGGMARSTAREDMRLGRSVALKILSRSVTVTAEARARFEARGADDFAASTIRTSPRCMMSDGHEGTDYLVMELCEGESLADRLARGALPTTELLARTGEIVEALAAAHRAGVIHRDLKAR
jgi:serine/threonine protein kinase